MNFLAHLLIAERVRVPLAGAVLGDRLRGTLSPGLPADLARSVRAHRRVDAVTDAHPRVRAARARFEPGARRYAGILLDLLYDHVLAADWPAFGPEPLEQFAARAAAEVAADAAQFAAAGARAPARILFRRLLLSYATEGGLQRAVDRTLNRLSRPVAALRHREAWRAHVASARADLPVLMRDLESAARSAAFPD